ncbi:MAG: glycoside hydrolase family 95 protein, partial [Clostridia bacterium]|nr:glycoside hydrolase family 95 protein [Clostridia bacterium]
PVWERILRGIPAYRLSRDGGIREWQDDRFEERYDHRHLSHIYPVFPGTEVHRLHQRELLPAFERAVRLREIDAQTGWSMAHMAAIYARLGKGEDALESLDKMSRACLTNSFFTLHNDWRGMNISWNMDPAPVQLDAIMGYVNAVQEMLIFAAEDVLFLLPALPQRLKKGEVRDFRYPGGYIDMRWDCEQGEFHATLRAIRTHTIRLVGPEGFPAKCTGEAVKQDPENTALWQVTIQ